MAEAPELKRGLFGYRTQDVETLLEGRERMFERATEEASRLRGETDELRMDLEKARAETRTSSQETEAVRTELNGVREELDRIRADVARAQEQRQDAETRATGLGSELRDARREITGLNERLRVADATEADLRMRLDDAASAPGDAREIGAVLEATQQAIARIMQGARLTAEEDLGRVRHTREEIQAEIDRVRSWRERVEPLVQSITSSMGVARAQLAQTADRVGEALRPMSDALAGLGTHLEELALLAPDPTAGDAAPDRVDLVSHEREQALAQEAGPDPWR